MPVVGEMYRSISCKLLAHVDRLLACLVHSDASVQDLHKRL